jgi:hypothetical protein
LAPVVVVAKGTASPNPAPGVASVVVVVAPVNPIAVPVSATVVLVVLLDALNLPTVADPDHRAVPAAVGWTLAPSPDGSFSLWLKRSGPAYVTHALLNGKLRVAYVSR